MAHLKLIMVPGTRVTEVQKDMSTSTTVNTTNILHLGVQYPAVATPSVAVEVLSEKSNKMHLKIAIYIAIQNNEIQKKTKYDTIQDNKLKHEYFDRLAKIRLRHKLQRNAARHKDQSPCRNSKGWPAVLKSKSSRGTLRRHLQSLNVCAPVAIDF